MESKPERVHQEVRRRPWRPARAGRRGASTTCAGSWCPRTSTVRGVPSRRAAGSTRAMARLSPSVGAKVPEVTRPTGCAVAEDRAPLAGDPLPFEVAGRPGPGRGVALNVRSASRPTNSPLSSLTAQPTPAAYGLIVFRQLVAVERHRRLEAERVAGPEPAGDDAPAAARRRAAPPRPARPRSAATISSNPSSPV